MTKVFKRICLEDYTIVDGDLSFTLKRGQEYITSREMEEQVRVFSQYWVWVPARLFAGAVPLV